jgi:hypothetical protein
MRQSLLAALVFAGVAAVNALALAQSPGGPAITVTPDNFIRAETDRYFASNVKRSGLGTFDINREVMPIDNQKVVRANRDTLYATAVFDLDAGPVTLTLPDPGTRFMAVQVITQDHYTPEVIYTPGRYTFTREKIGTRYVLLGIRILVDPTNPDDLQTVHALQDAIQVSQQSPGTFEIPNWDPVSQQKVRDALLSLAGTLPDMNGAFGAKGQVNPVRRLIGAAAAWGGNPDKDAMYLNVTPEKNDGTTVHRVVVKDVPVNGFWSISVYNAKGYYEANALNAYTINSVTGKKAADGAVTVQFGGCDGTIPNCLPIVQGWNYMVRLYRPRAEILSGTWQFPTAQPAY